MPHGQILPLAFVREDHVKNQASNLKISENSLEYAFMVVRKQPSIRNYWSLQDEVLHCKEVVETMSQNRFLHLLKVLHVALKESIVYDKTHL